MLERSARSILLIDHTKFDKAFFELVCPLTAIQTLVTDGDPPDHIRDVLRRVGVEIVVAAESVAGGDTT